MITETIIGCVPSKSNCYRIITRGTHASLGKTDALVKYEKSFYLQCKSRDKMISTVFELHIDVFYPSNRSDLDNAFKVVLDCLQATKTIKNDNLCVRIAARKFVDKVNPRIELQVIPVL